MREIKFRVFDKDLKKMHVVGEDSHDSFICRGGKLKYYNLQNGEGSGKYGAYVLMQYTGLKDKNGKEIYEGDIVSGQSFGSSMLEHWNFDVEYEPEIYVIKYHHASFKTFDLKGRWVAVLNHHVSSKVDDLQVIGNIFQDGDLLHDS